MSAIATWPAQAESWLDRQGKPAWIIAMILGFIVFWPTRLYDLEQPHDLPQRNNPLSTPLCRTQHRQRRL